MQNIEHEPGLTPEAIQARTSAAKSWFTMAGLDLREDWTNKYGATWWLCWNCPCQHHVTFTYPDFDTPDSVFYRDRFTPASNPVEHHCQCHTLPETVPADAPRLVWTATEIKVSNDPDVDSWLTAAPRDPATGLPVTCRCTREPVAYVLRSVEDLGQTENGWYDPNPFGWLCAPCLNLPSDLDVIAESFILDPDDPAHCEPRRLRGMREQVETALALGWRPPTIQDAA